MDKPRKFIKSNYSYLKHLAKRKALDIHPKGSFTTKLLIEKIDIKERQKILEVGFGAREL